MISRLQFEALGSAEAIRAVRTLINDVLDGIQGDSDYVENLRLLLCSSPSNDATNPAFSSLPFLCCQVVGGEERQATAVAAAWYVLLSAAHILDHLEDRDTEGVLWAAFAPMQVINMATGLILMAPLILARLRHWKMEDAFVLDLLEDMQHTALQVCAGQHRDLAQTDTCLEDYWETVAAKTGKAFALVCRAGARVGNGSTQQVASLSDFGYHLGVLNQIGDDLSGFMDTSEGCDLAAGRKTLPVLYALSVAPITTREHLQELLRRAPCDADWQRQARQEMINLGALHYVLMEAQACRQRAKIALQATNSSSPAVQQLYSLLDQASLWQENVDGDPCRAS